MQTALSIPKPDHFLPMASRHGLYSRLSGAVLLAFLSLVPLADAQISLPPGFVQQPYSAGLTSPTAMEFAPDGRLFVCEKGGNLRVIRDGVLLPDPFATVAVNTVVERGLLGITFDPDFTSNGYVYVYYTAATPLVNRVSRFTASSTNPDVAEPGSESIILDNIPSNGIIHQGGAIHFGPDRMLYVAIGDDRNTANAQDLSVLPGKILRLNPAALPDVVPADNPFVGALGARPEIWAFGLRNPFTFAIDPRTGRLFINDVGASGFEEINEGIAGANYGWPLCEGPCPVTNQQYTDPLYAYSHNGQGAAIAGGAFYQANQFPTAYTNSYFFADFIQGILRVRRPNGVVEHFATGLSNPVDLKVGPNGGLYYLTRQGQVQQIQYGLYVTLTANQPTFTTGDSLEISLRIQNLGLPMTMDFYFGVLLPDGKTLVHFIDLNFALVLNRVGTVANIPAIFPAMDLSLPFLLDEPAFFTKAWSGQEPVGIYNLFFTAAVPGSLQDNTVDPGDILALATTKITFTP